MIYESEIEALFVKAGRGQPGLYTIDVTGGIGSPRHYGGISKEPLLSPSHSHSACPATPTHNQHTNTQHFSSQQHTPLLYQQHTNANTLNTADMQNSQFCYDRSSVPLYPSGGEAQDARSLPPGNPVNHQMGGKSYDFLMSCDNSLSLSQPHATSSINCNYHYYHTSTSITNITIVTNHSENSNSRKKRSNAWIGLMATLFHVLSSHFHFFLFFTTSI